MDANNGSKESIEKRMENARKILEQQKQKEKKEEERYFVEITSGKKWKFFKIVMFSCLGLSILLFLDYTILPLKTYKVQAAKIDRTLKTASFSNKKVSHITFKNGEGGYFLDQFVVYAENHPFYLEKTRLFKDIKTAKIKEEGEWRYYTPLFTIIWAYPILELALLFPILTYFIKGNNAVFSFFFLICRYLMPLIFLLILISENRWIHLFTLGYL